MARAEPLPLIINLRRNQFLFLPPFDGKSARNSEHFNFISGSATNLIHVWTILIGSGSRTARGGTGAGGLELFHKTCGRWSELRALPKLNTALHTMPIRVRVAGAKIENFGPKNTIKMTFCKDLVGRQNLPHNSL